MYDKSVIEKHLTALILDLENLEKYKNVTKQVILRKTRDDIFIDENKHLIFR